MYNIKESVQEFVNLLLDVHGIMPLDVKLHHLACRIQKDLSDNAQKLLYVYFSLVNDGNTRIPMDASKLMQIWEKKWDGLVALARESNQGEDYPSADEFNGIIEAGIRDILQCHYDKMIEIREDALQTPPQTASKLFVMHDGYLYCVKHFDAKCVIENTCARILSGSDNVITDDMRKACQNEFDRAIRKDSRVRNLSERQIDAIIRGQRESLIITGGPGTGKTTVICFLLWKLLQNEAFHDWNIYLAAPSGKAADRIRESLSQCIEQFVDKSNRAYQMIHHLEGSTLHRLLSYDPGANHFRYHAENKFSERSIFVIDEASMIDVDLFASFMSALPDESRLYILGDADQLPSVDAGAVLGEMLRTAGSKCAVRLNVSHRFNDDSEIGKLACKIQKAKVEDIDVVQADDFVPYSTNATLWPKKKIDQINYISLQNDDAKKEEAALKKLIHTWRERFYSNLIEETQKLDPLKPVSEQIEQIKTVWKIGQQARILCAERRGLTGVEMINRIMRDDFKLPNHEPFYTGQLLMITKNQQDLKLYNGDSGIVVREKDSGRYHILLQKMQTKQTSHDDASVQYVFYPLSLLPTDALESAFAMTIHKSQGSGYPNIMMFLPRNTAHPLLNNQIIYTGVTRVEQVSLTIVSSADVFNTGCRKSIERDTGIQI